MTDISDEIKTTERSVGCLTDYFKQHLPFFLESVDHMEKENKKLTGFFKNPFSNPEMLGEFQKNIISPPKLSKRGGGRSYPDFTILSMLYLYIISKTDETIRFKIGCTRKPKMRVTALGYQLGECTDIHIFSVVAGFELERFLKVMLKEFRSDNGVYKTEIFEMPVKEYDKLFLTLQSFCAETKSHYFQTDNVQSGSDL